MKISPASWFKIVVFIVIGVLFGGVMVLYSNSQFEKPEAESPRDELKSMFGQEES